MADHGHVPAKIYTDPEPYGIEQNVFTQDMFADAEVTGALPQPQAPSSRKKINLNCHFCNREVTYLNQHLKSCKGKII